MEPAAPANCRRPQRVLRRGHPVTPPGRPALLGVGRDTARCGGRSDGRVQSRGRDAARFATYAAAGVNRLSFGVQSTVPNVLSDLGRRHDPDAVGTITSLAAAAGFATFNLDLIFGAAAESDSDWEQSLTDVLSMEHPPPHVSAYALTVEPGTRSRRVPGATPTTTSRPAATRGRTGCSEGPGTTGRRSRTGHSPATSADTTASTGARAITGASARPPTRIFRVAAGGTSTPPTLHRRNRRRAAAGGGRRGAVERSTRVRSPCSRVADPGGRARQRPARVRGLDGLVERRGGRAL